MNLQFGVRLSLSLSCFLHRRKRVTTRTHLKQKMSYRKGFSFQGAVANYKTGILAIRSTFLLDDSVEITIPGSSKEVYLQDGDTVFKLLNTSVYIVKKIGTRGIIVTLFISIVRLPIDLFCAVRRNPIPAYFCCHLQTSTSRI